MADDDFFRTARRSAAAEYGRVRAERYGRLARAGHATLWLFAAILLLLTIASAQGAFGG